MWYKNFMEAFEEYKSNGGNRHTLADGANLPYDTVKRIVSGKTENPTLDTLDRLATAMNKTLGDIVAGTRTVVGDKTMVELRDEITALNLEKETIIAERDMALAEAAILKEKSITQEKEIELLKIQILHKEELLSVHNAYLKLQQAHDERHNH